jgi:hypothetical protein
MAGLLGDVLPYVYGRSNVLKNKLAGLLSDPVGSLQQTAGLLTDKRNEMNALNALAFADKKDPLRVTDKNALGKLTDNALNGLLGMAPVGITAWHGTPHVFDKFDSSKIGTGEGVQAYGHGLYLAEAPEVAKNYASAVTSQRFGLGTIEGKPFSQLSKAEQGALIDLKLAGGDVQKALAALAKRGPEYGAQVAERLPILQQIAEGRRSADLSKGNLYKVDIPDPAVAKMLDWDKPISGQPEGVRNALAPFGFSPKVADLPGGDVMFRLNDRIGGPSKVAEWLRQDGIPGVRFLDAGSRSAGGGSSNFVVFPGEEHMLRILERNGQPLR